MHNRKGQALVEFVIIIPIVIYLIMCIVDLMMILNYRNNLESKIENVIKIYEGNNNSNEIYEYLNKDLKNVTYSSKNDNKYTYIELEMDYEFITPGLNIVLGNNYKIKCERVILNEQ